MLTNDSYLYSNKLVASLDKFSVEIDDDLDYQRENSKRDFHHEELCGWAVTPFDVNRFRWIQQRKTLKTPCKDRGFIRSSFRKDIKYEFYHYKHAESYIQQYRNDKLERQDIGSVLQEVNKSELCDSCKSDQKPETSSPKTTQLLSHRTAKPLTLFRGTLCGSKITATSKESPSENIPAIKLCNSKQSRGIQEQPSWGIVGVEKRPIPPQTKNHNDTRLRVQRHNMELNKMRQSSNNGFAGSSVYPTAKGSSRSNSAPNIGVSFSRQWKAEPRRTERPIAEIDYSCYTDMFKNVLEYYGTSKLKLKTKSKPGSAGNSNRSLSIKI